MTTYVWYSKSTSVTGKALVQALGCEGGIYAPKRRHGVVVCYGAIPKTVTHRVLDGRKVLNDAFIVKAFSNKYLALVAMQEAGIRVPNFSVDPNNLRFPLIRRTNVHHGGSGFELFPDPVTLYPTPGKHYIEFIASESEYRVHVFEGEVIKVSRKKPSREGADQTCRSHANGWYFSKCDVNRVHDSLKAEAIKAVKALGYDFGAVDLIYNRGGNAYVLEVNSGMGLDNSGIALYKECIEHWINNL